MDTSDQSELTQHLVTGFDGLQIDYEKLYSQYKSLESKLATARDQYYELAKMLGKSTSDTTPPLSAISTNPTCPKVEEQPLSATEILRLRQDHAAEKLVRSAIEASAAFKRRSASTGGVKIWSGPSVDTNTSTGKLPSITESPMEQDFTVVGVPSKLGCPFASMSGKKLSSHAASVLSRYHGTQSPRDGQSSIRDTASAVGSLNSRLNGRDSKDRRRSSMQDPIKAEICGMDSHESPVKRDSTPIEEAVPKDAEPGVCPIRFLNQHSPEELAQYFEKHKHELPRSHEVCVKRYQGNEQQVRELDARYSNVAQMIRGLGEKHQDFLPKDVEEDADEPQIDTDASNGKVERWANSLSPGVPNEESAQAAEVKLVDDDNRESHFARPLPDVRLGESPSRPWGIRVPAQYLEDSRSNASSVPVQISSKMPADHPPVGDAGKTGKCPFAAMQEAARAPDAQESVQADAPTAPAQAVETSDKPQQLPVIFNGPVIIGYSADEAARFLQNLANAPRT